MRPGLGIAHSDQQWLDMAMAESTRSALLSCLAKSAKKNCALKDVKRFCLQVVSKLESGSARSFSLARDQVFYF